jgi:malate synthase
VLIDRHAQVTGERIVHAQEILTPYALEFIVRLEQEFGHARRELLAQRATRQRSIENGEKPDFLSATESIRKADWQVAPPPHDLEDRRVEITGPTDAKMVINAMNSGAKVFMADFEDANAPTWENMIRGHLNLKAANTGSLTFQTPEGKSYQLNEKRAVMMVRPRGWHLDEPNVLVEGRAMSGSLFDFGLYFFHNANRLVENDSGPYFYLPKLESHREAKLWNDVFEFAQDELGFSRGTIRCTVLIETILAAFEMDEILFALRDHIVGLNAGRWDYIFSIIKKFRNDQAAILPDRSQITMTVPFMRAYTELLVKTCHRRGAHAMGGMAAFIPSRKDQIINDKALAKVREDKVRESQDGFDGTWVAHPDLVPVAAKIFDDALGTAPHQKHRQRKDVGVAAGDLLNFAVPEGTITEAGLRTNINVAVQYLESWLRGNGAVAINNLMEDTATAEISRAQIWQWLHHHVKLDDGREITAELYRDLFDDELSNLHERIGGEAYHAGRFEEAAELFDQLATATEFPDFLTVAGQRELRQPGNERIDTDSSATRVQGMEALR